MGCPNQAWKDGMDPAKLKQQWWGQRSSSKCPLILTAVLASLKFHKVHPPQLFVWSFCWTFSFDGSPEFLLLLAFSLICYSDQFLHQIQKTWKESWSHEVNCVTGEFKWYCLLFSLKKKQQKGSEYYCGSAGLFYLAINGTLADSYDFLFAPFWLNKILFML